MCHSFSTVHAAIGFVPCLCGHDRLFFLLFLVHAGAMQVGPTFGKKRGPVLSIFYNKGRCTQPKGLHPACNTVALRPQTAFMTDGYRCLGFFPGPIEVRKDKLCVEEAGKAFHYTFMLELLNSRLLFCCIQLGTGFQYVLCRPSVRSRVAKCRLPRPSSNWMFTV